MTPSGIEPATFRFVAQPLNHCATAVPGVKMDRFKFLGPFEKFRKAAISSVTSLCPSVRMKQLGSHWTEFHKT